MSRLFAIPAGPIAISRRLSLALLAIAAIAGLIAGTTSTGQGLERLLRDVRFHLRDTNASGEIHIVEIDARSLRAINRWPWDREEHARVLDRLHAAGAGLIAFDVDFSSPSANPSGDLALAAALRRAGGGVVLPTLTQQASNGASQMIDMLPAPMLRDHAVLAAVSMAPDSDGQVREAPLGVVTAGVARPSLSAMVAERAGSAGLHFPIDFAIDPATIPRHSFVDIRDGRFDPATIAGKRVLIGATAVEIGDRYGVPRFGVIPGVVVQALATETLLRGIPVRIGWGWAAAIALALAAAILRMRRRAPLLITIFAAPAVLFAAALILESTLGAYPALVPGLVIIATASIIALVRRMLAMLHRRRAQDAETGMPNRFAMRETLHRATPIRIATARIVEFDKLAAGLSPGQIAPLVCRVRDRLALVAAGHAIYRIEDRLLAWECDVELGDVGDRFEALSAAMLSPVEVEGRRVDVVLAFGAAEDLAGDVVRACANAALAADHAASAGDAWQLHGSSDEGDLSNELSLLGELDDAVANGEIEVAYQPKLDLATDRITSVEALVRWRHPTRGYLRPDLFIPIAEKGGRITGLTLAVLERTIADLQAWAAAGTPVTGAVNLSAKLVASPEFMALVRERIERTGIAPAMLTFEVTESAAMSDPAGAAAALGAFRALGVRISMDDYGTGQSTLSYIKQLPLDELKIDRSFVQFAHTNRADAVLVRSTVDLAHELGLKVVAEGVEDAPCLAYLRSIGCDMAQGYLISRPVPATALAALLAKQDALAAA
ncbi:EAL domain-containing protein [Sphingomonas sp. S1-29]|uniref:GGDEF domain-containing phosphodiesterase n=1 Tax=Sphingomonas sp. S1-29 TaxID=2991074 RepID=UPI00223EBDC6|nr:EAL domain-containing protein [Sphingomonas sp. S1-29]UZK70908.1 EAL domain-containing protein [Sphingomonas sp. S1-29]